MEVTKQNFKEVLSKLPDIINNAQFITIDTEFTGLHIQGTDSINKYDTPETLYIKDRERVESFLVIQYGIVVFNYNEVNDSYTYQGYNFYVYPSTLCSEKSFTCQASSMRFLSNSGFDFNKLFGEGIPYLREKEMKELQMTLDKKYNRDLQPENPVADDFCKHELKADLQAIISQIDAASKTKTKQKVHIPKFNSFMRRVIFKTVSQKYASKVFMVTNEDETMTALVGLSNQEYQEEMKQKYLSKKNNILENVGFSNVIKLISTSKKLIVGHNMLLDLMFTINQFIQPLPPTLKEFVGVIHCLFPKIIDTKYMASNSVLKNLNDTNLYYVYEYFTKTNYIPEVNPATESVGFGTDGSIIHKASYDAYLTGLCFLALCRSIVKKNQKAILAKLPDSPQIAQRMNKLWIRKFVDVPSFVNLEGDLPNPDRSNVFYMSFPAQWRKDDIMKYFQACGPIKISWISDTAAYICFEPKYLRAVQDLAGVHASHQLLSFEAYNKLA